MSEYSAAINHLLQMLARQQPADPGRFQTRPPPASAWGAGGAIESQRPMGPPQISGGVDYQLPGNRQIGVGGQYQGGTRYDPGTAGGNLRFIQRY